MSGKLAVYTVEKALGEILLVIRTEDDPHRIAETIEDVLQKLDSSSWAIGYKDAKNDFEVE